MTELDKRINLLLGVLELDSSLEPLVRRGFEYHQIIRLIDEAQKAGLVESDENGTRLTSRGADRVMSLRRKRPSGGPDSWIAERDDVTIAKADRWEVYLPPKNWRG